MKPNMDTDPSGVVGAVGAFVGAVLALLVAFGIDLTETQVEAVLGVVATGGPIAIALWIRRHAWSPASHEASVNLARRGTPAEDPR